MKFSKIFFKAFFIPFLIFSLLFGVSCSSRPLQPLEKLEENQEFNQKVRIQRLKKEEEEPPPTLLEKTPPKSTSTNTSKDPKESKDSKDSKGMKIKKKDESNKAKKDKGKVATQKNKKNLTRFLKFKKNKKDKKESKKSSPSTKEAKTKSKEKQKPSSNSEPYMEGEKLTYNIGYYNVFNAGTLILDYPEKVNFNGRQAYYFRAHLKSAKLFSLFYSVNDRAEIWIDDKKHFAHAFALYVDESKQKRKTKGFFDPKNNTFSFWETKVNRKGKKETKLKWEALPLTQNVFSLVFYLRFLNFQLGKEYSTPVADKGKNLIFKTKVLRKEELKTKIGTLPAWVLEPKIELNGVFKPMGKIVVWVSADENKYVLKITSKIKIGEIHISIKSIEVPY